MGNVATVILVALALAGQSPAPALAAEQTIRGKRFLVRDPGDASRRRVIGAARETGSPNTIVGDPVRNGALLDVVAGGGTTSVQSHSLPAAGWKALGTKGFKFSGAITGGAVRKVVIKRTKKAVFQVRVSLSGKGGALSIVPPNPGTEGGFVLRIMGGDSYCVAFGGAVGGREKKDKSTVWLVVKPSGEVCPPGLATSTTTSTTSIGPTLTTFPGTSTTGTTDLGTTSTTTSGTTSTTTSGTTSTTTSGTTSTTTSESTTTTSTVAGSTSTSSSTTTSLTLPVTTSTTSTTTTTVGESTTTTTLGGCDCCSFTRLRFTTGVPQIGVDPGCGSVTPSTCVGGDNAGAACASDATCTGGGQCVGSLDCGGLYFGGAGVSVPLPSSIPDMGLSVTKVESCNSGAGTFDIAATTEVDTGSNRTCTAAGVTNPEYPRTGCLFGPPLPVPNGQNSATSNCVINRIVTSATGTGTCGGDTNISFDLAADLFLTGDLLVGEPGIQPCPICPAGTCIGGPNDGDPCTPGTSDLGDAYPTTHDCPPPEPTFIGSLPIPFALTTGTATDTATDTDGPDPQTNVFCGFCRSTIPPNAFRNPPQPCTSNADCTTGAFRRCQQRTEGAFGNGVATTITETGTPAGCLSDGATHDATLVGVFCIPPSYNGLVDGAADIPGPGAVALVGGSQATDPVATTTTTTVGGSTTTSTTALGTTTTTSTSITLPTTTTTTTTISTTTTTATSTTTTVSSSTTTTTMMPCGLLGLICVGTCPPNTACQSTGVLQCNCVPN